MVTWTIHQPDRLWVASLPVDSYTVGAEFGLLPAHLVTVADCWNFGWSIAPQPTPGGGLLPRIEQSLRPAVREFLDRKRPAELWAVGRDPIRTTRMAGVYRTWEFPSYRFQPLALRDVAAMPAYARLVHRAAPSGAIGVRFIRR